MAKGTGSIVQDAIPFSKGKQKLFKDKVLPKAPKVDTSAQEALLEQQKLEQALLDEEENRRRKRLFGAAIGTRSYAGSPVLRRAPSNTAGVAAGGGGGVAAPGRGRAPRITTPRGYAIP